MHDQLVSIAPAHPRPARRAGRGGGPLAWLLVLLVLATIVAAGGTLALLLSERDYTHRIYPNISVRGVPVGNLSQGAARAAIERHYAEFLARPITLRYGEQDWQPRAADLGLELAIDEALAQALAIGRGDTRLDNLRIVSAAWEQGVDLPLGLAIDQVQMQRYLQRVAAAVELSPLDADVRLDGPQVVVTPERWGTQVLVDETLAEITAAVQDLTPQPVALRTRALAPRFGDADVAPIAAELQTLLSGPVVLESRRAGCADGCRWELRPAQIAGWISLRRTQSVDGTPAIGITLDQSAIRSVLLPIAQAMRQEGGLPLVDWNGGQLTITTPGTSGSGLDADQALAQINGALYGDQRLVELPVAALPPPVTESNLASLGIVTPVGVGVSSFANSADYRITNIGAGARQMHGHLLPPGASFSFNEHLGPVTAERGFVEGLAIIDNRTQKEWGGGLCQVSTTVFRAAFFGGLPITERHEHSFRIGWYEELGEPPGLDAAIFTGVQDMRFVNDTGGWLLIQSSVDLQRQRLTITLYGAPSSRVVDYTYQVLERTPAPTEPVYVDDPELPAGTQRKTDTARGGLKVEVYRSVYENGYLLFEETFPTTFKPWPDIYVRGTGL